MDLSLFNTTSLYEAATDLFKQLNIQLNSNTTGSLPAREILKEHFRNNETFDAILNTYFIGIVDDSIFREVGLFDERYSYKQALVQAERNYDGLMLFALELDKHPTRTEISDLTRSFNRISQKMPVGLLLKYENEDEAVISISISERFKYKQNWRQGEKAGKVIILRDIHTKTTHAGHIRILKDLTKPVAVTNYAQLHAHWLEVLDVSILNKRFFQELANWYFWAMDNVSFPDDVEKDKELRNATNLIRLITRIIFIWFIKEKKLVPNNLFRKESLKNIVVDFMKNNKSENFYHAILQNLFFGTLNQVIEERGFVKEGTFQENRAEYGVKNLFRYADKFLISEVDVVELFKEIPFLNGGLFDCLDKPDDEGKITYVDGFSRNPKKQSHIPDYIFFTTENEVDLNEIYGTRNKRYKVQGLINLLESYKFTVAENTPIEEEIALDPELLGKVFENLLASYNPETKTTARKQTGSYYTPREIVNYMVDESLAEYLKNQYNDSSNDFESNLEDLFSYEIENNPFNENETKTIIKLINNCKILDPACGSGAFPMGILHKMVHILNKLDSGNKFWKELQKEKAILETKTAYDITDHDERKRRLDEIDDVFENNASDYGRKLYLIENCIYGIDIQPIAVQIAKLRFFISLIIDQNKQEDKENFGIRSLPNLETKFVAANSLISLDKPELKTGDIFLNETYLKIKELSEELKDIRHKYFNAKKRTEKLKYQEKDKILRKKISEHLVKIGHTTINAHKIAAFDPYDQNHFAEWFEPEWMFGKELAIGFDIVIGNPPYGAKFNVSEKKIFRALYPETQFKIDSYSLFLLKTMHLLGHGGICYYIIPNTLLDNYFEEKVREKLLVKNRVIEIIDLNDSIFEAAVVHSMIIGFQNKVLEKYEIKVGEENTLFGSFTYIPKDYFINQDKSIFAVRKFRYKDLIEKLESGSVFLENIVSIKDGIDTGDNIKYLKDFKVNDKWKPVIGGKQIDRYVILGHNYILHGNHLANPRNPEVFEQEKIVVRETGDRIIATFDNENHYALSTLYSMNLIDKRFSLKFILALLNSKVFHFLMNLIAFEKTRGAFTKTRIFHYYKLPVKIESVNQKPFIKIVDSILQSKAHNPLVDISPYENQLDKMIYNIYGLSIDEISIIETVYKNSVTE